MSRLSRKAIIENTVSYCEKNKNKLALEQLMKISELFCRVYDEESKDLPDMDIDRILTILPYFGVRMNGSLRIFI